MTLHTKLTSYICIYDVNGMRFFGKHHIVDSSKRLLHADISTKAQSTLTHTQQKKATKKES